MSSFRVVCVLASLVSPAAAQFGARTPDTLRFEQHAADVEVTLPLVAQATLSWSTYLGGNQHQAVHDLAAFPSGDLLVAMAGGSLGIPETPGAFDPDHNSGVDVLLLRLAPSGQAVRAATYLGGFAYDGLPVVKVTPDGGVIVAGNSWSDDYPVTSGAFSVSAAGLADVVVSRLSGDLSTLEWSTYLGGSAFDSVAALDVRSDGSVVVGGFTHSADFPTTAGAWSETFFGGPDGFVSCLAADGATLEWSTLLGDGPDLDAVMDLTVAANDEVLVSAQSMSGAISSTPGVFQEVPVAMSQGGLLLRLAADGTGPVWLSWANALMVAMAEQRDGDFVCVGTSPSGGMPITPGVWATDFPGSSTPHAMRISGDGSAVRWGTYLPGPAAAEGSTIDGAGRPVFVGAVSADVVPVTDNAFQSVSSGECNDAYVTVLDRTGSRLVYGSYFGPLGDWIDCGSAPASLVDPCGGLIVGGVAASDLMPTQGVPIQATVGVTPDGWLARLQVDDPWVDLGGALAGLNGAPALEVAGGLCPGATLGIGLRDALPGANAYLVLGLSVLGAGFKGGTLWPSPDVILTPIPVPASGELGFLTVLPPGSLANVELVLQFWVQDPGAPLGFAATNGVAAMAL